MLIKALTQREGPRRRKLSMKKKIVSLLLASSIVATLDSCGSVSS